MEIKAPLKRWDAVLASGTPKLLHSVSCTRFRYFFCIRAKAIWTVGPKTNRAIMVMIGEKMMVRKTQPNDDRPLSAAIEAGSQM